MDAPKHKHTQHILVAGAGLFGSSTAKHLSILHSTSTISLLGPTSVENPFTCHNDVSRLYRSVSPSAYWSDLAERSIEQFQTIADQSGVDFFVECGYLGIAHGDSPWLRGQLNLIKGSQAQVTTTHTNTTFLAQQQNAGYLNPEKLIKAQLNIFTSNGGNVVNGMVSKIIKCDNNTYEVFTNATSPSSIVCDKIVLACGWNTCDITLTRPTDTHSCKIGDFNDLFSRYSFKTQSVGLFEVEADQTKNVPTRTVVFGGPTKRTKDELAVDSCYIVPPITYADEGKRYLKIGHGKHLERIIPSHEFDRVKEWHVPGDESDATTIETLAEILKTLYPEFEHSNKRLVRNGVTVDTADGRVIQEKIDEEEEIYVNFGCNGYGAKCSEEVGKRMANMII
ncbi:hypothetical protein TrST_g3519 [Triparma strigata]|uniref:FAD dependent oxidoreductase domain-containing protein n=1 Tax=Triparma strigata TaxID=1606541 RepID=A0A9W7EQY6_9STRA|nr:hypothetical protein TrST_g3519 [Triparma strigata]